MKARSTALSKAAKAKKKNHNPLKQKRDFPLIRLSPFHSSKVWVDRVLAFAIVVPLLALIAIVGLVVLAVQGRPVFYQQERVGRHGRTFKILKFRTMRPNAEAQSGPVWSHAQDQRVTWLGHWLRKTHLDEIPQIINVMRGEMSLVGPRPERPEFVACLEDDIPNYRMRHLVKPGITGLAQVRRGADACFHDVLAKTDADLEYVQTHDWKMDLALIAQTLPAVWKLWRVDAASPIPTMHLSPASIRSTVNAKPVLTNRHRRHDLPEEVLLQQVLSQVASVEAVVHDAIEEEFSDVTPSAARLQRAGAYTG